ncbi:MAG: hypothetical protein IJW63_09350 [Lachnospiraceae bacterium]|nr:hypothetical protein [Lachnospiraceae bacterium]
MRKTWKKTLASLLALALIVGTWSEGFVNVKANEEENTTAVVTVTANSIADPIVYDGQEHSAGVSVTVENATNVKSAVDFWGNTTYSFQANGEKYRVVINGWDEKSLAKRVVNVGDTELIPNAVTVEKQGSRGSWSSTSEVAVTYQNGSATVVPATRAMDFFVANPNGWGYIAVGSGSITGSVLEAWRAHGLLGTEIIRFADGYSTLPGAYSISYPASYPSIEVNNVTYTYDPACNRANTYSIQWTNVKAVKETFSNFIYHCNGTVRLQDENIWNVVFNVAEPGADLAAVSTASLVEGTSISAPAVAETKEVNGKKYVFTGWCTDAACTTPASISTLSTDTNYYGKYVEVQTLTLTPAFTTATYDGYTHVVNSFVTTEVNGLTVSGLSVYAEGRDAGSYDIAVEGSAVVTDAAGNDVTKYYDVVVADVDLVIAKKAATITSGSATSEYTGDILTNHAVEMEGFLEGEEPTVTVTGSQKMIGSSDNTFEVANLSDNYNVTYTYGKLTVTAIDGLVVSFADITKTYDGKAITGSYTVNEKLLPGHAVEVEIPSITDVDTVVYGETIKIVNAAGADVTDHYANPTVVPGTLTVNPIEGLVITFADYTKTYDGNTYVGEYTVEGLLEGHTIIIKAPSIKEVGTVTNTASYEIFEGTKNVTDFYKDVTVNEGTLTVNKITGASITFANITKDYDAQELVGTFKAEGFLDAHNVVVATPASITNAGDVTNTGAYEIQDAEGNDVSKYYDTITVTDGKLTVNPLKVTVKVQGNVVNVYYTGYELASRGYDVTSISSDLYTDAYFTFSGDAEVTATADSYYAYAMGLKADQFTNNNGNFDVTFEVTDGYLKIYYLEGVSPAREDGTDTPAANEPEVQEPEVTEPEVQEPEVQEPEVEEPVVEEPVVEEPVVEEPVADEVDQNTEPEVDVEVVGDDTTTEANDNLVQIEDEETPLANMDLDGDGNGPIFWILLAGVLATVTLFIFFVIARRKKEEEEEQA